MPLVNSRLCGGVRLAQQSISLPRIATAKYGRSFRCPTSVRDGTREGEHDVVLDLGRRSATIPRGVEECAGVRVSVDLQSTSPEASKRVRFKAILTRSSNFWYWPGPAAPSPEGFLIRGKPATQKEARSMARACRRSQSKWALPAPAQRSNRRQCRSCLAESRRTRRASFHIWSKSAAAGRGSAPRDETSRRSFSPPGEPRHFDQSRRRCRTRCPFAACSCCSDIPPAPREARSL